MSDWKFRPRRYPHFDHVVSSKDEALKRIESFKATGNHSFLPFLEEPCSNRRFSVYLKKKRAQENAQEVPDDSINKNRPIKYAAHVDAQIFSYYRTIISSKYEELLVKEGLCDFPIAYRKIPTAAGEKSGKCNIHFAKEAFDEVSRRGSCVALTFDIKGFFECLDHEFLKIQWCKVMEFEELPTDHASVFKAMTEYHFVDKDACYEALGLFEWKGTRRKMLKCPHRVFREQKMLCDKSTYREKVVSAGLVKSNDFGGSSVPQGIPQGSPMSDVLANIYMVEFDKAISAFISACDGYYRRYSDDILVICPQEHFSLIQNELKKKIAVQGKGTLKLNPEKATCTTFTREAHGLRASGDQFNYLGFTFDGQKASYRDRTISGYQRSTTYSIQAFARRAFEKHQATGLPFKQLLNVAQIFHKVGFPNHAYNARRKNSGKSRENNFMSYHLRSMGVFNADPKAEYHLSSEQLVRYKKFIQKKIVEAARKFDPSFSLK